MLLLLQVYSDEIKFDHMRINSIRDSKSSELPIMMLMKRSVGSKHTRNNQDLVRQWSDSFTSNLLDELRKEFKNNFKIILFSDRNFTMMKCHECQMKVFYDASVVIGVHGKYDNRYRNMNVPTFINNTHKYQALD